MPLRDSESGTATQWNSRISRWDQLHALSVTEADVYLRKLRIMLRYMQIAVLK